MQCATMARSRRTRAWKCPLFQRPHLRTGPQGSGRRCGRFLVSSHGGARARGVAASRIDDEPGDRARSRRHPDPVRADARSGAGRRGRGGAAGRARRPTGGHARRDQRPPARRSSSPSSARFPRDRVRRRAWRVAVGRARVGGRARLRSRYLDEIERALHRARAPPPRGAGRAQVVLGLPALAPGRRRSPRGDRRSPPRSSSTSGSRHISSSSGSRASRLSRSATSRRTRAPR